MVTIRITFTGSFAMNQTRIITRCESVNPMNVGDSCGMNKSEWKKWLLDSLAETEPKIGGKASPRYARIVAAAKQHTYDLGMYDLALSLPDSARCKTPLTACNQLKRCLAALDQPAPGNPDILSVPEIAAETGTSEDTIRSWITSRQLTASNVSTGNRPRYLVRREHLNEFLQSRELQPVTTVRRRRRQGSDNGFRHYRD